MKLSTLDAANDALQYQEQLRRGISTEAQLHLIQGGQPLKSFGLLSRTQNLTDQLAELGAHDAQSRSILIRELSHRFALAKFRWSHRQSSLVAFEDPSLARRPE